MSIEAFFSLCGWLMLLLLPSSTLLNPSGSALSGWLVLALIAALWPFVGKPIFYTIPAAIWDSLRAERRSTAD